MTKLLVNLDALIKREDFEVKGKIGQQSAAKVEKFHITEFESGRFLYPIIRKPDFQRETASWEPEKVADLIRSFLDGDLIPSIIAWKSPDSGNIFIIDGAHRLGALIAWVHNDYGDEEISRRFFENRIPDEQAKAADKTRVIIAKTIGTYKEMSLVLENERYSDAEKVRRAKNLGAYGIPVQWIDGDAQKAETSFFKINQEAAPIDATELKLLRARNLPNALAARAIIRAGTGHKYWGKFSKERQEEVEKLSNEINCYLFSPELNNPIKTLNLPIAGNVYGGQALPLLFDLINIANNIKSDRKSKTTMLCNDSDLLDDCDGSKTVEFLQKTKKLVSRISSNLASSLGLHPVVYFYSLGGRHQPTALLAVVRMIKNLEQKRNGFKEFTDVRRSFEDFILKYKDFINQTVVKHGSGTKGYAKVEMLMTYILEYMVAGLSEDQILNSLQENNDYSYLNIANEELSAKYNSFDATTKSAAFLRTALLNPLRCGICHGLIHKNNITFDHIVDKKDGGSGNVENAQVAHPYCNSTYKELVK